MVDSSVKIERLLGMLTVKLQDDNFVKWSYQFQSVLRGYDLFEFFNGESMSTKVLHHYYQEGLSFIKLTNCNTFWWGLVRHHKKNGNVFKKGLHLFRWWRVNQLKTEFHTAQKEADYVDKFLLQLKGIRNYLVLAGEKDNR